MCGPLTRFLGVFWTVVLSVLVLGLNVGLFAWVPRFTSQWLVGLQYDGLAIHSGDWYRLLTGHLVHWSPNHLYLDLGVFVIVGLLYERYYRGWYPWLLLFTALSIGLAQLLFWPEQTLYRGLSGVNGGQFAAALCVEFVRAWRVPQRWLWVGPAAGFFLTWLVYGAVTGRFFGGALLGLKGQPAVLSHIAGACAATVFVLLIGLLGLWHVPPEDDEPDSID